MNSKQKEDKLLDSIILPPRPISDLSSTLKGISKDSITVYPGLHRILEIALASKTYFDVHCRYECQRAVERLISQRARNADQLRNQIQGQEKTNDLEERPDEKQALEKLIQMLQAFLIEVNKDAQPYLEEHDIDELWTLVGSCDVAMEHGDSTTCYELVGKIHEELVDAIGVKSRVYRELADVMEGLSEKLEEAREGV